MSDDVKLVITGTFTVVILAWVILNYQAVGSLAGSLASNYTTALKALMPTNTGV